jgi:hypothetical protein
MMLGRRLGLDDRIGTRFAVDGYLQADASVALGAKKAIFVPVKVLANVELTGITYEVGGVQNGNVKVAIYNEAGERLAVSNEVAQVGTQEFQRVPFIAKVKINPGTYWIGFILSSATGTAYSTFNINPWKSSVEGAVELPANFEPPKELNNTGAKAPRLFTY